MPGTLGLLVPNGRAQPNQTTRVRWDNEPYPANPRNSLIARLRDKPV